MIRIVIYYGDLSDLFSGIVFFSADLQGINEYNGKVLIGRLFMYWTEGGKVRRFAVEVY